MLDPLDTLIQSASFRKSHRSQSRDTSAFHGKIDEARQLALGQIEIRCRHHPLCLGSGGYWRSRIAVEVQNDTARDAQGAPVAIPIGSAPGELALVGEAAEPVRVVDAEGVEMLFAIDGPAGEPIRTGPIPSGTTLTIPVECPAGGMASYYVYFDNASAWPVPEFLAASATVRNGGVEVGQGRASQRGARSAHGVTNRNES